MQLSKSSTPKVITNYFSKILQLKQDGKEFPVNLDDVWPLVYNQKGKALSTLRSDFIEGEDFYLSQMGKVVNSNELRNGIKIDAYLSVACLEYFIAKKVKPVFDVYRKVFHATVENTQKPQPRQISQDATYREGEHFTRKMGETMISGIFTQGQCFYHLNSILSYLGHVKSGTHYSSRLSPDDAIFKPIAPGSNSNQWFVNLEGFTQMLVYLKPNNKGISSRRIETVYADLFRKTIEGKPLTPTRHPYRFTHEQMNELFYEVSKIQRVKLQKGIYELLRGGLKL